MVRAYLECGSQVDTLLAGALCLGAVEGNMAFALRASAFAGDVAQLRSSGESSSQSGRCSAFVVTAKESRIGKNSVKVPKGVTVTVKDNLLVAKARHARPRRLWLWAATLFADCPCLLRTRRAPRVSCLCRLTRC